ncbi:MAG: Doubled motif (Paired 1), partial [Myxococcaceae bacterium]|nr:Doubled motif (Paired 1) [Myxococcaceae bacterium]
CMDCHGEKDLPPNPLRRQLEDKHTNIKLINHDEEHRWCLDCHDLNDRDSLHLAGGELVPFTESYRLCGQCHGPQYRDWKVGIHGKRTGYWNGAKRYLLCVNCHNPHNPRFAPIKPLPPPVRPQFARASDRPPAVAEPSTADGGSSADAGAAAVKEASHGK